MWRIALSMGMTFGTMALCALAVIVIFLIVPYLWESLFGPSFAVVGALGALGLTLWGAVKLMALADRLSGMVEARRVTSAVPARPDMPTNWPEYNAAIARNKRWAFYRRTRQFDRLRELEEEMRAAGTLPPGSGSQDARVSS